MQRVCENGAARSFIAVAHDPTAMTDTQEDSATAEAASDSGAADGETPERTPNTLLNGLIGGVVAVVLSVIPFSTVLGGGVAGYLEGGDHADGAVVGAIAGGVAFLPLAFLIGIVLLFVPVAGDVGSGVQLAIWVSVLVVLFLAAVYAIGLSILGGVLGAYVKENQ